MKTINIPIQDMTCCGDQHCLENTLRKRPYIHSVSVNYVTGLAIVDFDDAKITVKDIEKVIEECGFHCAKPSFLSTPPLAGIHPHEMKHEKQAGTDPKKSEHAGMDHSKMSHEDHEKMMTDPSMAAFMEKDMRNRFLWSLLFSVPIFLYSPVVKGLLGIELWSPIPANWLLFLLTTPVVFWFGSIFPMGAYRALKNKTLNMMVLIAIGVFAAYLFSVFITLFVGGETFFEAAALLVTFVLFGHWMEMKSRRGTSEALRALFNLVPPQARVLRNGKEVLIPTSEVQIGDRIILKPGDKVPVDGEVIEGETSMDESLVTGESLPVEKHKGDTVIGGSINQSGSVTFRATKIGSDTALGQIVKMVETAQNSKAPGQRIADKAAQYLVLVAVGTGLVTFLVWYAFVGDSLLLALTFAVSAIVIACPDALGLATPTAVAVGTGLGAKHNILIKDAATLEQASKIQAVVLDKTGTLTEGKPVVTDILTAKGFSKEKVVRLTAGAEVKSNHPLSQAVLEESKKRKITLSEDIKKFKSLAGLGIEAVVEGKQVLIGTVKLMKDRKVGLDALESGIAQLLGEGKTLMILAVEGQAAGVIAVADPVKPTAKQAILKMKEIGLEVAMITGDNNKTAEVIGKALGVERIFAEVLPEDKANYVKKLQQEGKFVAMVGDGINDAPALAQADIGIAIGAGTDVAIETANIVLMRSDPADILRAITLSKATVRKMKQNLVWASVYNVLAIPVAAGVLYPSFGITLRPEFSAILMSLSSIIVALNAVSLKRVGKRLMAE